MGITAVASCVLFSPVWAQGTTAGSQDTKVTEGRVTETRLVQITDPDATWKLSFYGFVKADLVHSDAAALSYGQENFNAPNQAKRVMQRDDMQGRTNIQLNDTRLGFKSQYGKNLTGVIELDFINFAQSSPNVNTRPRLRQAYVTWNFAPEWEYFIGQKWDIYSPLNMDTFNTINAGFYNGNHGWMREQIGVAKKINKDLTFTTAIGNQGINPGAEQGIRLEQGNSPSLAFQIKYKATDQDTFYLSGLTANKLYQDPELTPNINRSLYYDGYSGNFNSSYLSAGNGAPLPPTNALQQTASSSPFPIGSMNKKIRRTATGLSLGHEHTAGAGGKFRFKWEANYGQNIGDTFALGISNANVQNANTSFNNSALGILNSAALATNPTTGAPVGQVRGYLAGQTQVKSIREMSGWFSAAYKFDPKWEAGMFIAATKILNPEDLPVSNVANMRSMEAGSVGTNGWGAPGSAGTGMGAVRESGTVGYNLTYFADTGLRLFFQHEHIQTYYQDAERNKGILNHIGSVNVDTGAVALRDVGWGHERSSARANVNIFRFGTIYAF